MKRRTFLCLLHASDCAEECEVTIERGVMWGEADFDKQFKAHYRLVSYPASCKCGRPVMQCDPSQADLQVAYNLPEAEDV